MGGCRAPDPARIRPPCCVRLPKGKRACRRGFVVAGGESSWASQRGASQQRPEVCPMCAMFGFVPNEHRAGRFVAGRSLKRAFPASVLSCRTLSGTLSGCGWFWPLAGRVQRSGGLHSAIAGRWRTGPTVRQIVKHANDNDRARFGSSGQGLMCHRALPWLQRKSAAQRLRNGWLRCMPESTGCSVGSRLFSVALCGVQRFSRLYSLVPRSHRFHRALCSYSALPRPAAAGGRCGAK